MPLLPAAGAQRTLSASTFVNAIGSGIQLTAAVLYFTQAVRLPPAQVGLGLGVAGALSLAAGVLAGHWADRRGARGVYAATLVGRGAATAGFAAVDGFWAFLVVVCAGSAAHAAGLAARSPIIKALGGDSPQRLRAYLRAVTNTGISLGALPAGWAVQVGTEHAYRLLVLGDAALFLASAALLAPLPRVAGAPRSGGPHWPAVRDRPYLLLTALDGLMAVQFKVLTVAVPLWLVGATSAPHWLISGTMLVNTALVVLFQVPASRGVSSPETGGRAYRRAGAAFLVSCSAVPLSAAGPPLVAAAVLVGAVVVHTVGELWHSAGGFEVSFALAPDHATGQYLGVFGMGAGLADSLGPSLLIALCITWGGPGWVVLGALFAVIGLVTPAAVRLAERRGRAAAR